MVVLKQKGSQDAQPILVGPLQPDQRLKLDRGGYVAFNDIIGKGIRDVVPASKRGLQYRILEPSLGEYVTLSPRIVTPVSLSIRITRYFELTVFE